MRFILSANILQILKVYTDNKYPSPSFVHLVFMCYNNDSYRHGTQDKTWYINYFFFIIIIRVYSTNVKHFSFAVKRNYRSPNLTNI